MGASFVAARILPQSGAGVHVATSASPVALAWVYGRGAALGISVAPIPGTKRRAYLEQNAEAADLQLTPEELGELDGLADRTVGARY
jgi:aryl-alcohol dehydrogenase-like predicted oxidoreductase